MNKVLLYVFIAVFSVASLAHSAENTDSELEAVLKSIVETNFSATEMEDIDTIKKTMHTQSPAYVPTIQTIQQMFDHYDFKVSIVSFRYIGTDEPYAIARVEQKTEKVKGPAFTNNIIDSIFIFRKENGSWKLWQQSILETRFIE
jgi:hypothetical protein